MRSKLEELVEDDESFGVDAIRMENGFMINQYDDAVDYLIAEFEDRYEVYLNLFDDEEEPYRNILVKGSSKSLDVAKRIATRKLDKFYDNQIK